MISFDKLRGFINLAAKEAGFKSAELDFVSVINNGGIDWDHLNYFIDSFLEDENGDYTNYTILFYAFALNRGQTGDTATNEEKAVIWNRLKVNFNLFTEKLKELSNKKIQIIKNPIGKPDKDTIGNADTLWIFYENVEFRVFSCKDAAPTPLPTP